MAAGAVRCPLKMLRHLSGSFRGIIAAHEPRLTGHDRQPRTSAASAPLSRFAFRALRFSFHLPPSLIFRYDAPNMIDTHIPALEPAPVRRPWCVWAAVVLILLGAFFNLYFLYHHCPIDLSEDESHYWEWSRHIDYGYYSKPPGIAWVLFAAARVGRALGLPESASGEQLMPVLRTPAVLFGILSGLLSLALARRIFRDDRAALAVILLSAAAPMFSVGSVLITIDSPMYLCWAATVYCLWRHVESSGQWPVVSGQRAEGTTPRTTDHEPRTTTPTRWLSAAALACAAGMLFKPVLIAIPLCVLIAAALHPALRRAFKTWHMLPAVLIVLASQIPVILWNAQHHWVTFKHIGKQGGFVSGISTTPSHWYDPLARLGEYLAAQAGGMGGPLFILIVLAVIHALKHRQEPRPTAHDPRPTTHGPSFLLAFSLPLWFFYLLMNLWAHTEPNWPAAAYFAAMVLLSGFVVELWTRIPPPRRTKIFIVVTIIWGILLSQIAQNTSRIYPQIAASLEPLKGTQKYFKSRLHPRNWDPSARLKGLQERAAIVQRVREEMKAQTGSDPLIITNRYDTSSSLAFYLPDQPFVYSVGSLVGSRQSQYDVWPGLNEKAADGTLLHAGQNALVIGAFDSEPLQNVLTPAFERLEGPVAFPIIYRDIIMKDVAIYRAYGFKGLPARPSDSY